MIHQIGDVEVEVVCRQTDFKIDTVHDSQGRPHIKETPMYKATVVGQEGLWARGRSLAEAIGNVILSWPEAFRARDAVDFPRSEFFMPPIKSR